MNFLTINGSKLIQYKDREYGRNNKTDIVLNVGFIIPSNFR